MNRTAVLLCAAVIGLSATQASFAEGKSDKAAHPVSCKAEARAKGLTDKKEVRAYIKECKKAHKAKQAK